MPKKIILVRHGETDFNTQRILQGHLDTYLNIKGYLQAKKTAEKLKNEKIDVIISSDLKRAYHTALVIAQRHKRKVILTPLLRERHFGILEGRSFEESRKMLWCFGFEDEDLNQQVENNARKYKIENHAKIKTRLQKLLEEIKKHKNKTVVLVTHAGTMREFVKFFGLKLTGRINNAGCFYLVKNKDNKYTLIS